MRILVVLAALLLTACDRVLGPPPDGPGAMVVVQVDEAGFKAKRIEALSQEIREAMRRPPMVVLDPIGGRRVEGDHVLLSPGDPAKAPAAMERIGGIDGIVTADAGEGRIEVRLTGERLGAERAEAMTKTAEIVQRRMSLLTGFRRVLVENRGAAIEVRIPGLKDPEMLASVARVLSFSGDLSFNLVDVQATEDARQDAALWPVGEARGNLVALPDDSQSGMPVVIFTEAIIRSEDLKSASQGFDADNRPNINFQLTEAGGRKFAEATTNNVGRPFAIVLDKRIVSAPNIRSPITQGTGVIEGAFTLKEAEEMAMILRSGALPAPLKVVERRRYEAPPKID